MRAEATAGGIHVRRRKTITFVVEEDTGTIVTDRSSRCNDDVTMGTPLQTYWWEPCTFVMLRPLESETIDNETSTTNAPPPPWAAIHNVKESTAMHCWHVDDGSHKSTTASVLLHQGSMGPQAHPTEGCWVPAHVASYSHPSCPKGANLTTPAKNAAKAHRRQCGKRRIGEIRFPVKHGAVSVVNLQPRHAASQWKAAVESWLGTDRNNRQTSQRNMFCLSSLFETDQVAPQSFDSGVETCGATGVLAHDFDPTEKPSNSPSIHDECLRELGLDVASTPPLAMGDESCDDTQQMQGRRWYATIEASGDIVTVTVAEPPPPPPCCASVAVDVGTGGTVAVQSQEEHVDIDITLAVMSTANTSCSWLSSSRSDAKNSTWLLDSRVAPLSEEADEIFEFMCVLRSLKDSQLVES